MSYAIEVYEYSESRPVGELKFHVNGDTVRQALDKLSSQIPVEKPTAAKQQSTHHNLKVTYQ